MYSRKYISYWLVLEPLRSEVWGCRYRTYGRCIELLRAWMPYCQSASTSSSPIAHICRDEYRGCKSKHSYAAQALCLNAARRCRARASNCQDKEINYAKIEESYNAKYQLLFSCDVQQYTTLILVQLRAQLPIFLGRSPLLVCSSLLISKMVRKLKHHEQKLLRKVDFTTCQ